MDHVFDVPAVRAFSDAILAVAGERSVPDVLQRLVDVARELAGARYAALGVPDGEGGFSQFLTAGISEPLREAIGPLPRTHGLLAAALEDPAPFRIGDIDDDERFSGWWPDHHPHMSAMMAVPIVYRGAVTGAIYLADKAGGFTDEDQGLIEALAAHAAVAMHTAELLDRSRELAIVQERNRLARELHDAVTQILFGAGLAAESALATMNSDPAREHVERARDLTREAAQQMRALVFELRPPDLAADGLTGALRKHAAVLSRVAGVKVEVNGEINAAADVEFELYRIAIQALQNALQHAKPAHVRLELSDQHLRVIDDGAGFDPEAERGGHLGITTMTERAQAIGWRLTIRSELGSGTTVAALK